ncbi:hypothetical protein [Kitasatospora sp. NPDC047058]|uniref:hypothetical protein n=1 Tax=Kitasatospora sp. NPDC047058 TaxID=3155620 RepID=UPI0033CB5F92
MDPNLVVVFVLVALVVVLVLGSIVVLAALIAYIVRVCVARTRSQDMPTMVGQFTGLIGAVEKFTPRYQGVRELTAPLRGLQLGQQNSATTSAPAPQTSPVIPSQVVEPGTTTAVPAGGAQ